MTINVLHWLKLSGIGGVQSQYSSYIQHELFIKKDEISHKTLSLSNIEPCYLDYIGDDHFTGLSSIIKYLKNYKSTDTIVHSYNNLTSRKMQPVFKYLQPSSLILHERGNAWNLPRNQAHIVQSNCNAARLILTNSEASKQMLIQKFNLVHGNIKVLRNGVFRNSDILNKSVRAVGTKNDISKLVFLGRIESNKGLHVLLKAMKLLLGKPFELDVIGDGALKAKMVQYCNDNELTNVNFLGRIPNAVDTLSNYNLMVVPSIREPLGNIIIEAAINGVPVLAAAVDGIPEIIKDNWNGVLLEPKKAVNKEFILGTVPLPELVYYPSRGLLDSPMELCSEELAATIESTLCREDLKSITDRALSNVIENFSVESYSSSLLDHYKAIAKG